MATPWNEIDLWSETSAKKWREWGGKIIGTSVGLTVGVNRCY